MAIEKTRAFVLKTLPYRESSGIFYLLTERQGVVHGIAKGIRKKKTGASFLERGFLIETLVYMKPHRELHTLGDVHMLEYFPHIRNHLIKGAVRDAAFETILASVSTGFPAPEIFSLVVDFLGTLEKRTARFPILLWNFYAAFSQHMGFGISGKQCVVCKKELPEAGNLYLVVEKGGFTCEECSRAGGLGTSFPGATRKLFASRTIDASYEHHPALSRTEEHRITRQIASYCQYHCDTRSELKALSFLETILFEGAAD